MDSNNNTEQDYDKPVAYDADGRPLYAHPASSASSQPQVVHISRSANPEKPLINDATMIKHERSKQVFPGLNLSEGEYVISAVRRHPIGLVIPFAAALLLVVLSLFGIFKYDSVASLIGAQGSSDAYSLVVVPLSLFIVFVVLVSYVAYYIYVNNRFFLTNESVIQEIQTGLFSKHEQTVSLSNIEDASYYQESIVHHIFNYGSIRLSTEGDETTYRFTYVSNPKEHIATLNNAVEAFKNGRPVTDD